MSVELIGRDAKRRIEQLHAGLPSVVEEGSSADFGRKSRSKRFIQVMQLASAFPGKSFPDMTSSPAELAGLYRFFGNPQVTPDKILEPHVLATCERADKVGRILVPHDTSGISYGGQGTRKGLGLLNDGGHGYFLHSALALTADQMRVPLGVLGYEAMIREKLSDKSRTWREKRDDPNKESRRWGRLIDHVEELFYGSGTQLIHLLDREGDDYELLAEQMVKGRQFVIRQKYDRLLDWSELSKPEREAKPRKVFEALSLQAAVVEREVKLSPRRQDRSTEKRKTHPAREGRVAKLCVAAARVRIKRPAELAYKNLPKFIELNVVRVWEVDAPQGTKPVEWYLMTPLPIDTVEAIIEIVDFYRARWIAEEFYKALKTGCAIEKRQLRSKEALLNALAVFMPIAYRLLLLRTLARTSPELPATKVLSERQLHILRLKQPKANLPKQCTVRQALMAVAAMGGHLKHNGNPGWQVLGRGYEKLLILEQGYVLALEDSC